MADQNEEWNPHRPIPVEKEEPEEDEEDIKLHADFCEFHITDIDVGTALVFNHLICSVCTESFTWRSDGDEPTYCPNCGSRREQ